MAVPDFTRVTNVTVEVATFASDHRQEHCRVTNALRTTLGLAIGDQIRVNYEEDGTGTTVIHHPAVFTIVDDIPNRTGNVVQILQNSGSSAPASMDGGTYRLFKNTGTSATVPAGEATVWNMAASSSLVDGVATPSTATGRSEPTTTGKFIEKATKGDSDHRILLLVPHGGGIDDKTGRQIDPFKNALAGAASPSVWECEGQWSTGGTHRRWHLTAGDILDPAFPGLWTLLREETPYQTGVPYEYAYAFHGFEETGGTRGIVIGGRAPSEDKLVVMYQIRLALENQYRGDVKFCIAHNTTPPGQTSRFQKFYEPTGNTWGASFPFDSLDGSDTDNLVNRVALRGIQLEQDVALRTGDTNVYRDRIAKGLGAAASRLKNKVYMRDNFTDTGVPRTEGNICFSPDVTVRRTAFDLTNPQSPIFNRSLNFPSDPVEAGSVNNVYVRVFNRGSHAATGFKAHLWYAPTSTLALPGMWKPIGSLDLGTVPAAPGGNTTPTVKTMTWNPPASEVGHRCIVCVLDDTNTTLSKIQDLATDWVIEDYREFIRVENRAVWHNFNIVDETTATASEEGLPFAVPGAPEADHEFALDVETQLPEGWQVQIEVPADLFEVLTAGRSKEVTAASGTNGAALLSLPAQGLWSLGSGVFPGGLMAGCRLRVQRFGKAPEGEAIVRVRQLFEGQPLGAVTWQFV